MRKLALALAALAIVPSIASAQPADQQGDQIVVTGPPDDPQAIDRFVDAVGARTVDGHVARWHAAICPQVTGLREELNGYIAQTVTAIGEAAGRPAAGEGCTPNIVIAFIADPREFVETLRASRPAHLTSLDLREREALATSNAAARSWSVSELRTADGRLVQQLDTSRMDTNFEQGGTRGTASRISNELRADFSTLYLLVDMSQVRGVTMQQLSAFAAMASLTGADLDVPVEPARTILNLFHHRDRAPADITDWDIAYLHGLYATEPARAAEVQRRAIAGRMRDLLTAAGSD